MPTLLSDETATHLDLPHQIGGVELKVFQADKVIDCIDLPEGKCTIGSSPSCQIRITTGQLKPLQCLIIRSATETTVTRWAAGVLLNGAEFTTAPFRLGDCLAMGDVQLRLAEAEQTVVETPLPPGCAVAVLDRVEAQVATEVNSAMEVAEEASPVEAISMAVAPQQETPSHADADLARLHSANQQARQRFRRLIGTLRELREEARGLDHHVHVLSDQLQTAQHTHQQLAAELHQAQAISTERESQFSEELDRAIAELSASYERANAAEQSLQAAQTGFEHLLEQIEALTAECERLQQIQATSAAENKGLEQALSQREAEFVRLRQEFAGVQQALTASHDQLQEHGPSLQEHLVEITLEYDRQIAALQQELQYAHEAVLEAARRLETPDPALLELATELTGVRSERQDLTDENHRLGQQLSESEKRTQLLEIDVHGITAEWQQAQNTATRLQEAYVIAEAHIANLTAKQADLECAAALELSNEGDHDSPRFTEVHAQLAAREQALQELAADRDQHAAKLATFQQELAQRQQELADAYRQLTDLQAQLTRTEKERTQLAAELTARDEQSTKQNSQIQRLQEQSAGELGKRDARITELVNELQRTQEQASLGVGEPDSRLAELTSELQQTREKMSVEVRSRELQIAELAQELKQTQDHLSDSAAQGERLHELYRQAQADFATLNSNTLAEASPACEDSSSNDLPPSSPTMPSDDPRDDEEPRIVRALASAVAEPLVSETSEPAEEFEATSFIDRYSHLFDEESANRLEKSEPAPTVLATADNLGNLDLHDDSALQAYMANMMRRVRGEKSSEAITPPLAKSPEPENGVAFNDPVARMTTLTKRVSAPQVAEATPAKEEGLINLQELKGTSQKPPLPTSLSAMRELANISARQAIAKHRKHRHFEGALSKLLVSVIAGVTAATMLATAEGYLSPYFLAGCAVAVVSGFWGFKLLGIILEMVRDGINNEATPAELLDLADPLPIDGSADCR